MIDYSILYSMNNYELALLLPPTADEKGKDQVVEQITKWMAKRGKVRAVNFWGKKALAYPIKKNTEGAYLFVDLAVEPSYIKDLDGKLTLSESVMRHLLVQKIESKKVKKTKKPSKT